MKEDKNTEGFNTPQNYFDDFEERLFLKISEDKLPKNNGFKIPDNYFNEVEDKIFSELNQTETNNGNKIISLFSKKTIYYAASIAACAIIVFSLFNSDKSIDDIDEILVAEIEQFIEDENISFDTYEITSMLIEDEELNLENDLFSEELLEEYLLETINDTSLFLE
ncbi:MAG: hypothetical protein KUG68_09230 [Flavobacteriaceae bacterium]|nr:hypothetical protein [Flavobacteriaceae bacterium]